MPSSGRVLEDIWVIALTYPHLPTHRRHITHPQTPPSLSLDAPTSSKSSAALTPNGIGAIVPYRLLRVVANRFDMRFHRYEGDREQVQTDLENSRSRRRYGYGLAVPIVEMLLPLVMEKG